MILPLSTPSSADEGMIFLKIILFIYFIPSMIALFRIPIIKWRFLTVLFINLFFGWTIYGWWIAFIKAFSGRDKIIIKQEKPRITTYSKLETLEKLNGLKTSGAISEEEYSQEKRKILKS